MVHACWWYYFSKFTEFFDTVCFTFTLSVFFHFSLLYITKIVMVWHWFNTQHMSGYVYAFMRAHVVFLHFQIFFVMRKKNSQVSTLHVIHHGCMPMSVWFGVKFTPGNYRAGARTRSYKYMNEGNCQWWQSI